MNEWTSEWKYRRADGWIDGRMDGRTNEMMERQEDGRWMNALDCG